METYVIVLPEAMKSFVDKELAKGKYPDASAMFQQLLDREMQKQWKAYEEAKLLEAIEEEEQGLVIPWTKELSEQMKKEVQERAAARRSLEK